VSGLRFGPDGHLDPASDLPAPLRREDLELNPIWLDGYDAGFEDSPRVVVRAHHRGLGLAIALLIAAAFAAGYLARDVLAAPRPALTTTPPPGASGAIGSVDASARERPGTSSAPTGAPPVRRALEPETAQDGPSPEGPRVLAPMTGGGSLARGRTGILAYASRAHGATYLAIPIGPGHRVTICAAATGRCLERTSTDAGPNRERLQAGRIADVSFVDFAWLCSCDPAAVGTIRGSWRLASSAHAVTPPPTDVQP